MVDGLWLMSDFSSTINHQPFPEGWCEMDCKQFSKYIGEYVNRTLDIEHVELAKAHLDTCVSCAALVKELEATSSMVRSLNHFCAPIGFEDRLRERITAENTSRVNTGYFHRVQSAVGKLIFGNSTSGRRTALRPALAGLACALTLGGILFMGQIQQPDKSAMDFAYIDTIKEQHDAFAASNPLADGSAQMLKERANDLGSGL